MKKLYANGSRLKSNAGRPKKWNTPSEPKDAFEVERAKKYAAFKKACKNGFNNK
jgi:hypothetical protein